MYKLELFLGYVESNSLAPGWIFVASDISIFDHQLGNEMLFNLKSNKCTGIVHIVCNILCCYLLMLSTWQA